MVVTTMENEVRDTAYLGKMVELNHLPWTCICIRALAHRRAVVQAWSCMYMCPKLNWTSCDRDDHDTTSLTGKSCNDQMSGKAGLQ